MIKLVLKSPADVRLLTFRDNVAFHSVNKILIMPAISYLHSLTFQLKNFRADIARVYSHEINYFLFVVLASFSDLSGILFTRCGFDTNFHFFCGRSLFFLVFLNRGFISFIKYPIFHYF